jgi:hypothetical protein
LHIYPLKSEGEYGKKETQTRMEELHYWDARVLNLSCNYFGDELSLVYEDPDGDVIYKFTGCYKIIYTHALEYDKEKPVSEYTKTQIPYFLQDVELEEAEHLGIKYIKCQISLPPLELEILCENIEVDRLKK